MARPSDARTVDRLRRIATRLPEVVEGRTAGRGNPTWQAGKKPFAWTGRYGGRRVLSFKADPSEHPILLEDPRFTVARYVGRHGWLVLDLEDEQDWGEIEELIFSSYRQAALKRMLRALDG